MEGGEAEFALGEGCEVLEEGFFGAEGFALAMGLDGAVVDAAAEIVEIEAEASEEAVEIDAREGLELAAGLDAAFLEFFGGDAADAPELADGEAFHEGGDLVRGDDALAVGFVQVAGDFCQELVRGDAGGGGEAGLLEDAAANLEGDGGGIEWKVGDIEVGFIEGEGLDDPGEGGEDFADALGLAAIDVEAGGDDDELGALPQGEEGGHGGADAERAGLVGAGGEDAAAVACAADADGLAAERGVIALLDGRVEAVHIEVDDFAPPGGHGGNAGPEWEGWEEWDVWPQPYCCSIRARFFQR